MPLALQSHADKASDVSFILNDQYSRSISVLMPSDSARDSTMPCRTTIVTRRFSPRQGQDEPRPTRVARLAPNRATVSVHDCAANGESQARHWGSHFPLAAFEFLENSALHSANRVAFISVDGNNHAIAIGSGFDLDRALRERIFPGVFQNIDQYTAQSNGIKMQQRQVGFQTNLERPALQHKSAGPDSSPRPLPAVATDGSTAPHRIPGAPCPANWRPGHSCASLNCAWPKPVPAAAGRWRFGHRPAYIGQADQRRQRRAQIM